MTYVIIQEQQTFLSLKARDEMFKFRNLRYRFVSLFCNLNMVRESAIQAELEGRIFETPVLGPCKSR